MNWIINDFNNLTNNQLHDIYCLRNEVFVVEQNCVYQDIDGKDKNSYHVFTYGDNEIAAYSRIVPPGFLYDEPSIGRVIVKEKYRMSGLGKELMFQSINYCKLTFRKNQQIIISAQEYLSKFYTDIGFKQISETYLEDNIPHIKMKFYY